MQFGSPRAAGPSDGGLGEAGGGPWTPASPFGAEGEGGQGGLGEGSWGEGGTRPEAACGSEAWGLPGHWDVGAEDPKPQPRQGLVLHRADAKLSRTRLHRPSGGGWVLLQGATLGAPARNAPGPGPEAPTPCVFRSPRPGSGIFARPRPAPTLRRRHRHRRRRRRRRRRPGSHGQRRGQGGARHDVRPPPPRPARAPLDSPRRGVPPNWHSPHPRRPSQIRWHPAPPATGGRRKIAAQRSPARPPDHPSARPPGASRVPPPRRAEEGLEPGGRGGGPGRARLPFSAAAAEPARGPAPAPLPRSLRAAAGADYSGSGSAPSSAPASGPRLGPGAGAGRARKAGAARPGPLRQRLAGPGPVSARRRVAEVRERAPSRALPATVPPARLPSSPPASGPACRAASSGAHYRVAGGVGPARLRALVPRRRVPARPLLSPPPPPPPPPPPARPPSLPPGPPACLARSLPPSARCRAPSLRLLRRVPPSHPFSPPSSFPPSGRPRAQASARCSPPAAALAPAPALRSRPARQRRLGGPGAPRRERSESRTPQCPDPAQGPGTPPRPFLPATPPGACGSPHHPPGPTLRGAPRYLALLLRWVPASSTGLRDSGPSSPAAGVKCLPPGSPRSPRRLSPCSSPDLHQSPLHSACLSTGAGDSSAGPSASQPPRHPPPPPGAAAE
ncbi:WAS/WASL-interacting protein family member 1-like [Odocoileus virginianus]|uniref:WAS/WASL-interacting protein family member 1-like n=1 Tax=Odocoileus virginianus TaxID=9874 RepID=A0ABM4IM43_ODOVR